jgi:hypothetical protein
MKTQLDIFKSAQSAAEVTLENVWTTTLDADEAALEAFKADATNDRADWPAWRQHFIQARSTMNQLKGSRAASTQNVVKAVAPEVKE